MTQEQRLHDELDRVGSRYQRLLLWIGLATCWLALAGIALGLLLWGRTAGRTIPGFVLVLLVLAPVVAVPILWALTRTWARPVAMARRIERRFPELDARLITALEQRADGTSGQLGFLQQAVIEEALDHARRVGWEQVIPPRVARAVKGMHHALAVVFAVALLALVVDISRRSSHSNWWTGGVASRETVMPEIQVEPGDTSIERGSSLLVLARFEKRLPNEVQLLERDADGQVRQMPMSRSLDDPLFAGRVGNVSRDLTYAVRYGDAQTKWYKATVFDYPELRQADVQLKYPTYTKLPEKLVEDTRSVSAVEGTRATFKFRLNKPVAEAQLVPSAATTQPAASAAKLSVDPKDSTQYSIAMDLARSQSFRLVLKDSDGRNNKEPPELVINVTQNRPPELKLEFPGHDVDVSPLEELSLKAKTSDDFGVARVGVTYAIAGQPPQDVVLDRNVPANRERDVADLIALEKLAAKPDQLLSYHFWAEDFGPDGKIRRTSSDMFFAEVRPFDQIFRQGQQPTADQQQQQQQQRSRNAQQAEELAELQKQIVAATWKVMRREITTPPSAQLVPDAKLIAESQSSAKEKAAALGERLQDERSSAFLKAALGHMDEATGALNKSGETNTVEPLASALSSEQAAYQDLLKLRAREHDVVRGGQQQQQQGGNSSAQARRQRQLDQLDLAKQDNRYASERSAPQQQQDAQQRETRQVLSRLRELAQRQEDLNRQMRELEAQLAAAKQEAQREELKRQLARLRDQQQQMLRDTDELRDRMDQPENQQRLADSRQQLEQTRSNVRRASEALQKGMVPEAASAGARAAEQLNNLREQVRSSASGQFSEAMDRMRQNARELDQNQQDLSQRLATLDGAQPKPAAQGDAGAEQNGAPKPQRQRTLRDAGERRQVAQDLEQQKQKLQQLMDSVRKTVEDAETAEPLLSRQLYDAARQANQNKTDEALDASKRLLDRGFVDEAQKAENDAGRGIAGLRQGIEKAAQSVLGDEAEALRRARGELDALAQELDREMQRAGAAGVNSASTRPGAARQQVALGGPSTRRSMTSQPGQGGQARSPSSEDRQARAGSSSQPSEQQQGGQESRDQSASQPGSDRPRQSQQQARNSGGRATTQDSSQGGQPGSQDAQNRSERASNPQNARDAQRQGDSRNNSQQARGGQSGQQPGSARDGQSGQQSQTSSARTGGLRQRDANRAGGDRGGSNEDLRRLLDQANNDSQSGGGADSDSRTGPLTGGNFRDWSDRLRDVEEMVGDPRLRAQAAQVRDRARAMRAEFDRHSKEPNWDLVREFVGRPLVELRDKVAEELLRRGNAEALVPIDREPVPAEYSEQVQKYYEKLGSGR